MEQKSAFSAHDVIRLNGATAKGRALDSIAEDADPPEDKGRLAGHLSRFVISKSSHLNSVKLHEADAPNSLVEAAAGREH